MHASRPKSRMIYGLPLPLDTSFGLWDISRPLASYLYNSGLQNVCATAFPSLADRHPRLQSTPRAMEILTFVAYYRGNCTLMTNGEGYRWLVHFGAKTARETGNGRIP